MFYMLLITKMELHVHGLIRVSLFTITRILACQFNSTRNSSKNDGFRSSNIVLGFYQSIFNVAKTFWK